MTSETQGPLPGTPLQSAATSSVESFLRVVDIGVAHPRIGTAVLPPLVVVDAPPVPAQEEAPPDPPAPVPPEAPVSPLAPELPDAVEIFLTRGGNGTQHLGPGWSVPELLGTWTDGPESLLLVPGLDPRFDHHVWLPIGPFLHPPEIMAQDLRVMVNGVEILAETLDGDRTLEFMIPASLAALRSPLELVLKCSRPTSPNAFGLTAGQVADGRLLGFAVWGLRFTPRLPQASGTPGFEWVNQLGPVPKVAAVTMVFNEAEYLPIWLAHNARQVGIDNCYVIDHGSTDGSTADLGRCNVVRIPRSPYDPNKQSEWNSRFCASLLTWFDWVIYSDVDEILLPDPAVAPTLVEYCRRPLPNVVTAIGLNVLHRVDDEPALDLQRPITVQRPYVFGCASMCKPLLINRRVAWAPGSHSADAPVVFDQLYMFHLRWFDMELAVARMRRTRTMDWAQDNQGAHQRVPDAQVAIQLRDFGRYERFDDVEFDPAAEPVLGFLREVQASTVGRENDTYKVDLGIWYRQLWHLPKRFIGAF